MFLLITAAGEGSRFAKKGIKVPKPLIRVKGRTLLEHTLDSFKLNPGDHLIIAVQRVHGIPKQLDHQLKLAFPFVTPRWIELDSLLPGQLSTAVTALDQSLANSHQRLLIHNCDTGFIWQKDLLPSKEAYGSMAVFTAEGDHWSFGQPDPVDPNRAIAIAEKKRISNLASIGLYGFQSVNLFLKDARKQLQHGELVKGEHYIAPLLQQAIKEGNVIQIPRVEGVRTYGTPEELCTSFNITFDKLLMENS